MGSEQSAVPDYDAGLQSTARRLLTMFCDASRTTLDWSIWNALVRSDVSAPNDVEAVVTRFPHIFLRDVASRDMRIELDINHCRKHASKRRCDDSACKNIHCCPVFLFGPAECSYGERCNNGHDLGTADNKRKLERCLLDHLSVSNIAFLLKHCGSGRSASSSEQPSMPTVCRFYNVKSGCIHGSQCRNLHICQHFVRGTCKFGHQCSHSHDVFSDQPKAVLLKSGVDVCQPAIAVLDQIRASLIGSQAGADIGQESTKERCTTDRAATIAPARGMCPESSLILGHRVHQPKFTEKLKAQHHATTVPAATETAAAQDTSQRVRRGYTELCIFHVQGKCHFGVDCNRYHSSFDVPYVWQWSLGKLVDENMAGRVSWTDFSQEHNSTTERMFCSPLKSTCFLKYGFGDQINVDFGSKSFTRQSDGTAGTVRRLSTQSVGAAQHTANPWTTLWRWYRQADEGNWSLLDASDAIEHEYKEKQLEYQIPGTLASVRFKDMLFINVGERTEQPVRRRPTMFESAEVSNKTSSSHERITAVATGSRYQHDGDMQARPQQTQPTCKVPGNKSYSELCMFHLRGICRYGDACCRYHSSYGVPYQWRLLTDSATTAAVSAKIGEASRMWWYFGKEANAMAERIFCDQTKDTSYVRDEKGSRVDIDFCTMKFSKEVDQSDGVVERLDTESVNAETHAARCFTTHWNWFSKSDRGDWTLLPQSDDIEQEFKAKRMEYQIMGTPTIIHFGEMLLVDLADGYEHVLKRRPAIFRFQQRKRQNNPILSTATPSTSPAIAAPETPVKPAALVSIPSVYPSSWSFEGDDESDFQQVPVANRDSTAEEFEAIAKLFAATLPGEKIKSLQRIQNTELWEDFSRHLGKLEKKKGKDNVETRRLFHGTQAKYVDAISQQGFDCRLSGMSVGTLYGKGSYFARDAKYSQSYCGGSNLMFVVKVIVGEFTVGKPDYVRPPAKDPKLPLHQQEFYDSCANDLTNPAIFVVFHQHQAYPEYLVEF